MMLLLFLLFLSQLSCSAKKSIKRNYTSQSPFISVKSDGSFFIYSDCNIILKPVQPEDWKKILQYKPFTNEINQFHFRIPKLHFFQVILENRERYPVQLKKVELFFAKKKMLMVSDSRFYSKYSSVNYKKINYNELFAFRKIVQTSELDSLEKLDTARLIKYSFNFIPANTKVYRIIAFEWIPVQYRTIKISFTLKYPNREKVIDFKLARMEYRSDSKVADKKY